MKKILLPFTVLTIFCFLAFPCHAFDQLIFMAEDEPYHVKPDGTLYSATIDLVREMIKRVGMTDNLKAVPWARGYKNTQDGPNYALVLGARTAERENMFKWIGPFDRYAVMLYAKKDSGLKFKSLDDAKRVKAIACIRDDVTVQELKEKGFTNIDELSAYEQAVKKLMAGRDELMSDSPLSIKLHMETYGFKEEDVVEAATVIDTELYMLVSKQVPDETCKALQTALENIKKEGLFETIFKKNNQPVPIFKKK